MVLYRQVREGLVERGVGLVTLTRSFRSVPNIQQFVNAAFETEMTGDADVGPGRLGAARRASRRSRTAVRA